jgi:DNA-binding transcriptional LysR family regulator
MHHRKLHKFIILTIIMPVPHDYGIRRKNALGDPMLEDLRALVEIAHAGPITDAADRLFRTPSAITRQVQRPEAALGAELFGRLVKPPRLNTLGSRVLEQARDLLQRTEALKSLTSSDAEPHGLLRIGLSHALAEGSLIPANLSQRGRRDLLPVRTAPAVPASPRRSALLGSLNRFRCRGHGLQRPVQL